MTLTADQITNLSLEEIRNLRDMLDKAEAEEEKNRFLSVCEEVKIFIDASPFSIDEIFNELTKKKHSKKKAPAKFQDPENPENTWTGRGRMPNWMKEKVENGAYESDFRIDKQEE